MKTIQYKIDETRGILWLPKMNSYRLDQRICCNIHNQNAENLNKTKMSAHTFLSHLLPYETDKKKNGFLRKGLKEFQSLLIAFLEATEAFQNGRFEKFDSLVGENACQIRAVWMAIVASKGSVEINKLNERIIKALKKIDLLLTPKSIDSLMGSDESLKSILEKDELDISLTIDEAMMIQSYLLCEMKVVNPEEKMTCIYKFESTDPKKIKRFGDITSSFADNLLSRLRKLLAASSVQFIRERAAISQSLTKMVSEDFTVEQNSLPCIPMFWTYKTVLEAVQSENIPLIIHVKFLKEESNGYTVVDEEKLFFKFAQNGSYVAAKANEADLDKAGWVIQGVATAKDGQLLTKEEWKASMTQRSIIDVILAGAADHRQFPDQTKDHLVEALQDSEYLDYKALAKKEGFSTENPTTFFIQHVYASRVGNILEKLSIKKDKIFKIEEFFSLPEREKNAYSGYDLPLIAKTGSLPASLRY